MASSRAVPLLLVALAAAGCQPVTRPGVQVADTRSVLLETVATKLPGGAVGKTTYPHGSRNTRYAAVLIVGDYTTDVANDENPGSEQLLASWAEGLGQATMLTLRVTDVAPSREQREVRVLAAWDALLRNRLVDRKRVGLLVQGDAFYTVAPLLAKMGPKAVVLAGCPGRSFSEVALERATLALEASDGSLPKASLWSGVQEWEKGKLPGGPFWTATFGGASPGYYQGSFDWQLPAAPANLPALVLSGDAGREGSDIDAVALSVAFGVSVTALPLTDRNLKPKSERSVPGPTDPVVPDALEATLEFLDPILEPSNIRED